MTFDASVPLNSDSPAIFPAQNQTNMSRLQTIVGADHQFNLSAAANDGYHNLIHLTQQAPAGALAATGRLYVKTYGGSVHLFYMSDLGNEYQITPDYVNSTMKISSSASIAGGATQTIFSVAYDFTGIGVALIDGTSVQRTYNFSRSGAATDIHELDSNVGGVSRPTIQFSGTDLTVKNNDAGAQTVVWSLMINRL
jgi:hypothetical protein